MRHNLKNHPTAGWFRAGVVLASNQEAQVFLARCGAGGVNGRESHYRHFGLEELKRLKELGVNLVFVSGQKGAGFEAEGEEVRYSRAVAEHCHQLGLKVGTYIGNTLLSETLFKERPEARGWAVVNAYGEPYYYQPQQTFHFVACRNNPGYRDFLKEATRISLEEIGVDFLHYDNWFSGPEPMWCRCEHCRRRFREFLVRKYRPADFLDIYGVTSPEELNPPNLVRYNLPWSGEPWRSPVIRDPLLRDWTDFQCQALADNLAELAAYARSIKPEVVVECNPSGLEGTNTYLFKGVDHQRLLPHVDAFWSEEGSYAALTPEGELVNRVRNYKAARFFDQALFTYISGPGHGNEKINAVESLAFNPLSLVGLDPAAPFGRRVIEFRNRHRDLFLETENISDAAVLRQFESQAYFPAEGRLQLQLAEQTLIQGHVPFDPLFDRYLELAAGYRCLVLPEVAALSDGQVEQLFRMVRDGLGLVVTGATSTFDQYGRRRSSQPLGELWGETSPERNRRSIARRREAGRGRVAYLPRLELIRPVAPDRDWGYLGYRTFQLPGNWRELAEAVEWAAGGFSICLDAPETVLAEFLRQPEKGRLLVHLVNYRTDGEASGLRLRIRPELVKGTGGRVRLVSFDPGERRAEGRLGSDGWLEVTVDWLESYAIVVIE